MTNLYTIFTNVSNPTMPRTLNSSGTFTKKCKRRGCSPCASKFFVFALYLKKLIGVTTKLFIPIFNWPISPIVRYPK